MEGTSPPPMPWPEMAVLLMAMNGKRHGDDATTEASEEVAACFPIFILTRGKFLGLPFTNPCTTLLFPSATSPPPSSCPAAPMEPLLL
jgi:hypothetical protein